MIRESQYFMFNNIPSYELGAVNVLTFSNHEFPPQVKLNKESAFADSYMLPFSFTTSFLMLSNIDLAPDSPPISLSLWKVFVKLIVLSPYSTPHYLYYLIFRYISSILYIVKISPCKV